jgi:hypothetical protein
LTLRTNLAACVTTSVLTAVFVWPLINPSAIVSTSYDLLWELFHGVGFTRGTAALEVAKGGITQFQAWTSVGQDSSAGVIAGVYNTVQASGSIERAVVYAVMHLFSLPTAGGWAIAIAAFLLTVALTVFVRVPLSISALRFFTETRVYPETPVSRLTYIFRRRRTLKVARAAVYKYAWLALWAPTIIMAPVKYYSYLLYDYILAENPDASPRAALRLSQALMKGHRGRACRLDLSFAPWYALGLVTFGLPIYFYASPYRSAAFAELYVQVRGASRSPAVAALCTDSALVEPAAPADAIAAVYPEPYAQGLPATLDFRRDYCLVNLVCLFFAFSFIGWVYESTLSLAYVGRFVNRGTLYGPWIPVYGTGGVAVLVILKRLRERPFVMFLAAMGLCGMIEYAAATLIYDASGLTYWSYDGYFFNIQGRVCLEGLLVFGLACSAVVYFLAPLLDDWLNRIPLRFRYWLAGLLVGAFLTDSGLTLAFPRSGPGITD